MRHWLGQCFFIFQDGAKGGNEAPVTVAGRQTKNHLDAQLVQMG